MPHKFTNHLVHESSPYLLQHAHNPVEWYPWGEEALQKAKKEDKPILVSIGYAACHWCHVMERESFEDEATASLMNKHYVNIKIDREERPDLDHIYMDAVQAISGSGGWPLNVFLTPEGKPFYGGTYFPPSRAFNRPSWKEILLSISQAYNEKKDELYSQAETLTRHIFESNQFGIRKGETKEMEEGTLTTLAENLMKNADKTDGGFGKAPKFPQTFSIQLLLRDYYYRKDEKSLEHALLSLDKMIQGGIYDQLGGGFARYSTDSEWLAPHFEKMLYDNALLIITLSEAFQLTGRKRYREVIYETVDFIERELMSPEDGFYSALDADSEGVEGKFYVWDHDEVNRLLGPDAALFNSYYDIRPGGNWEHKTILRVLKPEEEFIQEKNISQHEFKAVISRGKQVLFEERSKRIRPLLDDKILLGWNALMNQACSKAFMATGDDRFLRLAERNMEFILKAFKGEDGITWFHTYKEGKAKYPAFLDDLSYLVSALISLQEITGKEEYLQKANGITELIIQFFGEEESGYFFYTNEQQSDVIVRKKEVYDGAIPSGNAIMAHNLLYLSIVFDKPEWRERSLEMVRGLEHVIVSYPTSFGVWASLLQSIIKQVPEIVLTGKKIRDLRNQILFIFIPHRVFQSAEEPNDFFPLLRGKTVALQPLIFLCKNYNCLHPSSDFSSFVRLLETA